MAQEYTLAEVGKHNTMSDFWGVYEGEVYNVTSFLDSHPGGKDILEEYAGKDFTEVFHDIGHSDKAKEELKALKVGILKK